MHFSRKDVSLETKRLLLRTLEELDGTRRYADWLNDPDVNQYLATKSATVESVREYIRTKRAKKDALFFGMFLKGNRPMIGTIKLEPIDTVSGTATIALMIGDKEYWSKGYGPEALRVLIRYGFDELHLRQIDLGVIADNVGAIRAYEKVGFQEAKRVARKVRYGNQLHDHITMVVTPQTFLDTTDVHSLTV